ncbi:carboxypeptidase-like regulatory domain-containing protein [Neolewinella sp.]|uniref:carboxypeptidase-like regulatory domain-containing protein n=1 Tax=Neolewinella sp. TaxID=2993543 RepID=UPI003B5192DD
MAYTPLVGVNILTDDSRSRGAVSDENGAFALPCTDSLQLRITYVGYESLQRSYACTEGGPLVIALSPVTQELGIVEVSTSTFPTATISPIEQPGASSSTSGATATASVRAESAATSTGRA